MKKVPDMTNIEAKARNAAYTAVAGERMCENNLISEGFPCHPFGCQCKIYADKAINTYRDSLTVPEEAEDLAQRLDQVADMDLRFGGIPAHTIDTAKDAATLIRQQAAQVEPMRSALERAEKQFRWYAEEHTKAGKTEKAKTNSNMADMCAAALRTALDPSDAK